MNKNNKFLGQLINAAFPAQYFVGEELDNLVETYGEEAKDGGKTVKTVYCRQNTEDINSRRAAGVSNESPQLLSNGKLLVVKVDPTLKIWNAVQSNELENIDIISNEELSNYIEQYKIPEQEEV